MKLMIASDIHGSAYYCEKLFSAFADEQPDRLVLLGDLLYHGPRNDLPRGYAPKAVAAMLNAHAEKILCVRGNCEAEVDQMILDFPVLSDSCLIFADGRTIFVTHGHLYHEAKLPPLARGDILLSGHTHIPKAVAADGVLCVNPGSVSIPKEGSTHSYMVYEHKTFFWKNMEGSVYKTLNLESEKPER
jgi:putative phosphoesterase